MLVRQKVILAILDQVQTAIDPIRLVKLVFLLRRETVLAKDPAFYDFVPYLYGPFSFSLYREIEVLRRDGYLIPDESKIALSEGTRAMSAAQIDDLSSRVRSVITSIVATHGKKRRAALLKWVYANYPWYAINSQHRDLIPEDSPPRPRGEIAIYTSGYQGKSVDRFFDDLMQAGVQALLDVRSNPVSRKYGFAGGSLRRIGAKLGMDYHHLPELGISTEDRRSLGNYDSYQRLLDKYENELLPRQENGLNHLIDLLKKKPSVLVCMERDVNCCHRGRLAKVVANRAKLPIVHLPIPGV